MSAIEIVDLFAGPGGWSEGLRTLGLRDFGLEHDASACATRYAAGHSTWQTDITTVDPADFHGATGLIASPPCPDFSAAGKGAGIDGPSGRLVKIVPEWVDAIRPEWVACEQVPPALWVWREHAELYRSWGYSVWAGILNSADYGVPQTRERAILIASRTHTVQPPTPTHAEHPHPTMFGPELLPWVSMADALGWDDDLALEHIRAAGMTERHDDRPAHPATGPAPTVEGGMNRRTRIIRAGAQKNATIRRADQPSPTITASMDNGDTKWFHARPATTVQCDPRIGRPGHKDRAGGESQFEHDAVKVTLTEALILQGFRPDYPVQGNVTKSWEQVGNAVPPPLAAHVAAAASCSPTSRSGPHDVPVRRVRSAGAGIRMHVTHTPEGTPR